MVKFIIALIAIIVLAPIIIKKFSAGKWEITVMQLIKPWQTFKAADSELSDQDLFIKILDHRYDKFKDSSGMELELYQDKEKYKNQFILKIAAGNDGFKYNLSTVALACLMIEKNDIVERHPEDGLLDIIKYFLMSQGIQD